MTRSCTPVLLFALAAAALPRAAHACDCSQPGSPCVAFSKTRVVFSGRVTQITQVTIPEGTGPNRAMYHYNAVTFDVEETFRGPQRRYIEVTTGQGGGDCGMLFRTGERYLVYTDESPSIGRLYTGICSRTRPLSEAGADLDFLRKRGDPGRGAGIEGDILELDRDPKTNDTSTRGMMKGVRMVIEGSGKSWNATTDNQGWFSIWGLPPGEYTVRGVLPRNFVPEGTTTKVRITAAACGWVHMLATPYPFPQPKEP